MKTIIKTKNDKHRGVIRLINDNKLGFFIEWENNGKISTLTEKYRITKFWKTLKGAEKFFDSF